MTGPFKEDGGGEGGFSSHGSEKLQVGGRTDPYGTHIGLLTNTKVRLLPFHRD